MIFLNPPYDPENFERRNHGLFEAGREGKFLSFYIESSSACNLSCRFCDLFSGPAMKLGKANSVLKPESFAPMLREIGELGYRFKRVYYNVHGEPLINRDLERIVAMSVDEDIAEHYTVTTNGVLLDQKRFDALVEAGINSITVSHETVSRERYASLMGGDHLTKVMGNVAYAIKRIQGGAEVELVIKTTKLMNETKSDEAFVEELIDYYRPHAETSSSIHIQVSPEWAWVSGQQRNGIPDTSRCCDLPFYMGVLHVDGRISCCCVDNVGTLTIGKLGGSDGALKDILRGPRLKSIREAHLSQNFNELPACATCNARGGANPSVYKDQLLAAMSEW